MKTNEKFIDFNKLRILLTAEQMTLKNHPDGMPFLALFLREIARDKEEGLSFFSRQAANGNSPREMVSSLDLSNIKNEILAAICLYLLNTKVYRKNNSTYNMNTILSNVPNYDLNDQCNKEILSSNPLSLDISDNPDVVNSIFDAYLLQVPDVVSKYIDGYLQTIIAMFDSNIATQEMESAQNWNQAKLYSAKEVKFIQDILKGKNKSWLPPKTRTKNLKEKQESK